MKTKLITILTFAAVLLGSLQQGFAQISTAQGTGGNANRINKVKRDLSDVGLGNTITVSRIDNRDFFGRVTSIRDEDFEITETDSKIVQIFKYEDIKNVRPGDGSRNYFGGVRKNPRHRFLRSALIAGAVIGGLFVLVAVGLKED